MGDDDQMLAYIFSWHLLDAHINSACRNGEDQPVPTAVRIVFGSPQARTTKSVQSQRPSNSILYCGASPVFVDIDPDQFNIDTERIEAAITPLTRVILVVHQIGMPCDLARIVPLAKKHVNSVICKNHSEVGYNYRLTDI